MTSKSLNFPTEPFPRATFNFSLLPKSLVPHPESALTTPCEKQRAVSQHLGLDRAAANSFSYLRDAKQPNCLWQPCHGLHPFQGSPRAVGSVASSAGSSSPSLTPGSAISITAARGTQHKHSNRIPRGETEQDAPRRSLLFCCETQRTAGKGYRDKQHIQCQWGERGKS